MVSLKSFKIINETESDIYDDDDAQPSRRYPYCLEEVSHPQKSSRTNRFKEIEGDIRDPRGQILAAKHRQRIYNGRKSPATTSENNNDTSIDDQNNKTKAQQRIGNRNNRLNSNTMEHSNFTDIEQQQNAVGNISNANIIVDDKSDQEKNSHEVEDFTPSTTSGRALVAVTLPSHTVSNTNNDNIMITSNIDRRENTTSSPSTTPTSSSISIVVVKHDNINNENSSAISATNKENCSEEGEHQSFSQSFVRNNKIVDDVNNDSQQVSFQLSEQQLPSDVNTISSGKIGMNESSTLPPVVDYRHNLKVVAAPNDIYQDDLIVCSNKLTKECQQYSLSSEPPSPNDMSDDSRLSVNTESDHFEIVWTNLSYRIEPKWHKKFNYIDQVLTYFMPGQTVDSHSSATSTASSSAGMNDNQHQMHSSTNTDSHLATTTAKHRSPSDPIEIFTNLNGTIKSGQMTAVLGPSGAGKTTLLNCLTGKLRKGVSGHINLKGANGKHLKMCIIPQKDHLLEQLTVEENLWFASKIKNPEYGFDHVKNIERVIDLLGLKRCRSAKIKKISGGQHKRVSIAQELLSNPDILVLDEPTSGLDSLTCFKTISMLRDLVELSANNDFMKPMAIIVTIHQPQPKVFNLFHHVYILANGGRVIYEGPPDRSVETITEVTGLQPVDSAKSPSLSVNGVDPASFLIEIASEEYGITVINTLSEYQRSVFNENLGSRRQYRESHAYHEARCNLDGGAKINHAFSPEFESDKKSHDEVPSVLVVGNNECQQVASVTKESPSAIRQRSGNDSRKSNSPKTKHRRKSNTSNVNENDNNLKRETSQQNDKQNAHDPNLYLSEQLLYTRVPNHKGRFWSHTATLTHRTLLTIRRDPLLMTSRVLFHLMIPILMGHVYGKATGAANACPHYEPEIDITQIPSLVENKRIEFMLEELHMSIENVSMFFIIMYAFAAAVLALNALSFPLNMQVLLKETRNGWYSMSSYVLAKTLADLPLELTMPCMTMLLVYPLTGQPSSYLQWRMFTICLIMTLCSLIAQTQALILGALVMNSVQTAVFVSQASQLPWVILAGFTIRIKRLSEPLKLISLTSFYRLGCEAITLTRYGFGICPCDPREITGEPVRLVGIPDQLRTVAQYWIDSVEASKATAAATSANDTIDSNGEDSTLSSSITTTIVPPTTNSRTDIFQHLANQLSYANSYGVNITSCDDVAPDRIRAINLGDNWLVARIWHLIIMLIIMKILLYYAVRFSIGIRL